MNPEEKKLLEDTLKLSQENNAILRQLRRSMRIRRFISIVYWILIIGSTIGAYYYAQPYIDQMLDTYTGAKSNFDNLNGFLDNLKNMPR